MNCPICGNELVQGDEKQYENLSDHVSDPNNDYGRPLRPTYTCVEEDCPLDDNLLWWDEMGDLYIENYDLYHNVQDRLKELCIDKVIEAHNSFAKKLRMQDRYNEKTNELFKIGNYRWAIKRKHECNEAGTITKYRFYIQTFKKDTVGWCYYTGFWRMLTFCIGDFNRHVKEYRERPNEWIAKKVKDEFKPLEKWQMKDNYRKVFKWYVSTFYSKLKEEVK